MMPPHTRAMTVTAPPRPTTTLPTFAGIERAAQDLRGVLAPTPVAGYPALDRRAGCTVLVKHENVQPTGAFKVRGGLAFLAGLDQLPDGIVTSSTGNHAQSIAYAAARAGLPTVVVMPVGTPQCKQRATAALGARVVVAGADLAKAAAHATSLAVEQGWRFVASDEVDIIHGHATVSLELLTAHPELEALYVPVGSGTGAAGACLVRDAIAPRCRIIGVQSAQAPAAYDAWRAGAPRTAGCTTRVGGLATAASFDRTQRILTGLDDFLLVDDDAIDDARRLLARCADTVAEGAGAAALAGLLADPNRPQRCAIIVSGGNADARELASL